MPSFTFKDCPTSLTLSDTIIEGKAVSGGSVSLTVSNTTARSLVGTLSVQPEAMAGSGWVRITGASSTHPAMCEIECAAHSSQAVRLEVAVPAGTLPGWKIVSLRITTETDPDNDFSDSPGIAFEIEAPAHRVDAPRRFPSWIPAVAASVILAIGLAIWWLLPGARMPKGLIGSDISKAIAMLVESDLALDLVVERKPVPGDRILEVLSVEPAENVPLTKGQKVKIIMSVPILGGYGFGNMVCNAYTGPRLVDCKRYYAAL